MGKSTHSFGQPVYGQLIKSLDRDKIVELSLKNGGEKYVKSFNGFTHLLTMLYAVIMRFDSLREIEAAMTAEVRKLHHIGIDKVPKRSTLSDANARRSEKFFQEVYRDLYQSNRDKLSSDSRRNGTEEWLKRLRIIDSTTITLFSNVIFKGVGRHPKTGKKKGGIKVYSVIHANEGVHCDVRFTSAATNDSFMLAPSHFQHDEIVALDRAYINYGKFEELTERNVVYVTKMKKSLKYEVLVDCMDMNPDGKMEYREQVVVFRKDGISLQQHYDNIRIMVKEKTGRAMQEKDVEFTDKKGKKRVRQGCSPIREGVVNIKSDTTMDDLLRYVERVHERWGIRAIQIHIHRDEGHYENPDDQSTWQPNFHAHIIWDWMNHNTGKSYKLNAEDMSARQDLVAETLDMQRGQKKSETGIDHLERNDFIIRKQESKKKQLQEEAKKAVTEKEEAEAEVKVAKTEVADLWKEHDYLTNSNRTKVERSNRLDFDIKTKQNRSDTLDNTIEAKSKEVSKLAAQTDEKLQEFYTIKERGDWQDPLFFAMSAYIYRFDEGLQFCIQAIQNFAYSGFGGRGGKHGDFFWDNESYAIKHYMKKFADLASATFKQVADWFVWLASTLGKFNANELKRADHEVHDIADGRYDGRIQKYQQGLSR